MTTVSTSAIREAERLDILERRRTVGLNVPDDATDSDSPIARTDLVGVALSGGGQRSACFCLGLVQAFFKSGVWRYVDYLSTISGGGYLGGYLSSLVLKEQRVQTPANSQLMASGRTPQSPDVQRFIYGGYSMMRPWELFNKYLIGLVLINAGMISVIVGLCAAVAFLWRCLDYPWVRDRLALLDLGSDLQAPFWPFTVFFLAWLGAWMFSYFRRGAEAPGKIAKRLLFLTVGSGLIAITLLLGNGDIGRGFGVDMLGQDNPSAPQGMVTALVALVIGGLIPFLRPKRLIESGLKPNKKPLEKFIFNTASTALLVGVPLILIGVFGQENISGYNDHPFRPVVKEDIEDWRGLVALYLPGERESLTPNQQTVAHSFRQQVRRASQQQQPISDETHEAITNWPKSGGAKVAGLDETEMQIVRSVRAAAVPWIAAITSERSPLPSLEELTTQSKHDPFVSQLALAMAIQQAMRTESNYDEVMRNAHEYRTLWLSHYLRRGYYFAGWLFGIPSDPTQGVTPNSRPDSNPVTNYWRAKMASERYQDALCYYLNEHVMASGQLSKGLIAAASDGDSPHDLNRPGMVQASSVPDEAMPEAQQRRPELAKLVHAAALADVATWPPSEQAELNRRILEHEFPLVFRDRTKVRRRVTIFEDQKTRLLFAGGALGFFVLFGMWVDLNATSLHYYYRNRLQQAYLVPQSSKTPAWSLSKLHTTSYGAPYHLIAASVGSITQLFTRTEGGDYNRREDPEDVRRKRIFPFLFSRRFCGSEATGYMPTEEYEGRVRGDMNQMSLSEAVALSGAAVTPHNVQNALVAFLMMLLNLRLGQWIPNPSSDPPKTRPSLLYVLSSAVRQMFRGKRTGDSWYRFVTDGGYSDNLGLLSLLERRCRLIIAVDAGCDPAHRLDDLAHVIRIARVHHGIRFLEVAPQQGAWRPDALRLRVSELSNGSAATVQNCPPLPVCDQHFSMARIQYPAANPGDPPQPAEGLLIYIKPAVSGDESLDVRQYQEQNQDFPHQSTSNQLYDQSQVEAYRQLGYHTASELCRLFPPLTSDDRKFWDSTFSRGVDVNQLCSWLTGGHLNWTTTATTADLAAGPATPPVGEEELGSKPSPSAAAAVAADSSAPESAPSGSSPNASLSPAAVPVTVASAATKAADEPTGDEKSGDETSADEPAEPTRWDPELGRIMSGDEYYFQPINVMEQPQLLLPEPSLDVQTEQQWDEVALQECLSLEDLNGDFEDPRSPTRELLLAGLKSHPIATTRVAIVDKLGELRQLPREVRDLLLEIAKSDPHVLVRSRAEFTARKRSRAK